MQYRLVVSEIVIECSNHTFHSELAIPLLSKDFRQHSAKIDLEYERHKGRDTMSSQINKAISQVLDLRMRPRMDELRRDNHLKVALKACKIANLSILLVVVNASYLIVRYGQQPIL